MPNPIRWFEIYVQDLPRARSFYENLLQIKLTKLNDANPELWSFPGDIEKHGSSGALAYMPGVPSGNNSVMVYFACDDCATTAARAADAGGKIFRDKISIGPFGFISLVIDTEGNMIGLHSMT
jgi:predicted enzyme related to lactoylglutathione lyase